MPWRFPHNQKTPNIYNLGNQKSSRINRRKSQVLISINPEKTKIKRQTNKIINHQKNLFH